MRRKFAVVCIGVAASLLMLEIGLRIIGAVSAGFVPACRGKSVPDKTRTIICLGDSFTFGVGAPSGKGYPEQLESELNAVGGSVKFRVLNRGVKSYNTSQILRDLPAVLENTKPDLVIVMAGDANYWNYWGYQRYLKRGKFIAFCSDSMYRIRIFKLLKLLVINVTEKYNRSLLARKDGRHIDYCGRGWTYKARGNYEEAARWFQQGIKVNPRSGCYVGLATICQERGDFDAAVRWLKQGIMFDPANSEIHVALGWAYRQHGDNDKAIASFKEAIRLVPGDREGYIGLGWLYKDTGDYDAAIACFTEGAKVAHDAICHASIGWTFLDRGDVEKGIEYLKEAVLLKPDELNILATLNNIYKSMGKSDTMTEFLNELSRRGILPDDFKPVLARRNEKADPECDLNAWIASDYRKIIALCKERGSKVLVQDYPFGRTEFLQSIARENAVAFTSTYKAFSRLWDEGKEKSAYFIADGHCNAQGYAFMAQNLAKVIIKDELY